MEPQNPNHHWLDVLKATGVALGIQLAVVILQDIAVHIPSIITFLTQTGAGYTVIRASNSTNAP